MKKKLAIISGGTSGLGAAIAESLADDFRLALIFKRNQRNAFDFRDRLRSTFPSVEIEVFQADLSSWDDCCRVVDEIHRWDSDSPDLLINNAGISRSSSFIADPIQDTIGLLENNLFPALYLSKLIVPEMYKARRGCVISIGSTASRGEYQATFGYAMAKAAIETMTVCCSRELYSRKLQIHCLRPGLMATPATEEMILRSQNLQDQLVPVAEVAAFVRHIVRKQTTLSGQVWTLDQPMHRRGV